MGDHVSTSAEQELRAIRRKLKEWERSFGAAHGRKPTSGDVDLAPAFVRDCYKDYRRLKAAINECSLADGTAKGCAAADSGGTVGRCPLVAIDGALRIGDAAKASLGSSDSSCNVAAPSWASWLGRTRSDASASPLKTTVATPGSSSSDGGPGSWISRMHSKLSRDRSTSCSSAGSPCGSQIHGGGKVRALPYAARSCAATNATDLLLGCSRDRQPLRECITDAPRSAVRPAVADTLHQDATAKQCQLPALQTAALSTPSSQPLVERDVKDLAVGKASSEHASESEADHVSEGEHGKEQLKLRQQPRPSDDDPDCIDEPRVWTQYRERRLAVPRGWLLALNQVTDRRTASSVASFTPPSHERSETNLDRNDEKAKINSTVSAACEKHDGGNGLAAAAAAAVHIHPCIEKLPPAGESSTHADRFGSGNIAMPKSVRSRAPHPAAEARTLALGVGNKQASYGGVPHAGGHTDPAGGSGIATATAARPRTRSYAAATTAAAALASNVELPEEANVRDMSTQGTHSDRIESQIKKRSRKSSLAEDPRTGGHPTKTAASTTCPSESPDRATSLSGKRRAVVTKNRPRCEDSGNCRDLVAEDGSGTAKRRKAAVKGNFVKLNLKVKKYARCRQKLKGARLKRSLWKKRVFGSRARRGTACFACGKEGHWSNSCPERDLSLIHGDDTDAAFGHVPTSNRKPLELASTVAAADCDSPGLGSESAIVFSSEEPAFKPVQAVYSLEADGCVPATPPEVLRTLELFGHETFRHGQEETVMRILCGRSTLVTLSTGGGKSLCYQLPAHLYRSQQSDCTAIVVSPLVSLMEDQIHGLPSGIAGECLHSQQSNVQQEKVWKRYIGKQLDFLLISPEFATSRLLSTPLSNLPRVPFVCIDEAHCLSEWSHNFRPSYLRVCKTMRESLRVTCFLGLTATASWATVRSIAQHLALPDYLRDTIRGRILAPNLNLSVSLDEDKEEAVLNLLQGSRFKNCNSIIIYCTRREQTERLASLIRTRASTGGDGSWSTTSHADSDRRQCSAEAECYHAGLTPAQRRKVQRDFMSGSLRIIVATVAFGMGLDKSDVRGVIHFNMPASYERYVQEIGRAGRDGLPADCHLLLDASEWGGDMAELKKHTFGNTVDRCTVRRLLELVLPQSCSCAPQAHSALTSTERSTFESASEASGVSDEVCSIAAAAAAAAAAATSLAGWAACHRRPVAETAGAAAVCRRHERALPIEATTLELDMREEAVSTLLCYLELHPKAWVINMNPAYASCTVQSYAGADAMRAAAEKCACLARALALARAGGRPVVGSRLTFPVVDLSDAVGRPSSAVKRELKQLSWEGAVPGKGCRKTGIVVEFHDLAFHFMAVGGLTATQFDELLDFLYGRVVAQEEKELAQLREFYYAARSVAHKHYWSCADVCDDQRSRRLREAAEMYFTREQPSGLWQCQRATVGEGSESFRGEPSDSAVASCTAEEVPFTLPASNEDLVRREIRTFIDIYGVDHCLTARAIARILQGIGTPQFPSETWGRVRRFWRSRLDTDFNTLRRLAASELLVNGR